MKADAPAPQATSSPPSITSEGAVRRPRGRRHRLFRVALVTVPLLIILLGLYYVFFVRPYESTDDAFIDGDVTPLAPQVSGRVVGLLVSDNQAVRRGDLLVAIDPRDYDVNLAQARARLAAATAESEKAKAQ